jgi:3-oxoacyl-[acyl-carrier protein] reductase
VAEQAQQPVALVTGTRKGIGAHLAKQLVTQGYRTVGCSRKEPDWESDGYTHICADVSNEAEVKSLFKQIRNVFGRLDLTVNNAGIASMNHALLTPGDTVDRIMNVNFRGAFLVSRESAKLMRGNERGRIVNLTTVAVPMLLEGESVYAASKGALEVLTKIMAKEFASEGITVNAIGPTPIDTDLIRGIPKEKIDALLARLPIQRLATMDDVMNVVEFFARPESDNITGQVVYLGGS